MTTVRVDQLVVGDEIRGIGRIEYVEQRADGAYVVTGDASGTVVLEGHNEVTRLGHEHKVLMLDAPTVLMTSLSRLVADAPAGTWELAAVRNRELVGEMPADAPDATKAACAAFQRILDAGAELCAISAAAPPEAFEYAERMQRDVYEKAVERDGLRIVVPEDGD